MIERTLLFALALVGLFSGCATTTDSSTDTTGTDEASDTPAAGDTGRAARIVTDCTWYTTTPEGSMKPQGTLHRGRRVRLISRHSDGWADIRLGNGQTASVLADDVAPTAEYQRIRSRTAAARRKPFTARRGSSTAGRAQAPAAPPPADYREPSLPDAVSETDAPPLESSAVLFPEE